jgi:chorismate dehydratase
MWDFAHDAVGPGFHVHYTIPSQCAEELREGSADIGIIPVFTYALIPDLVIIPDIAIATKGVVRSILLISKVPVEQIRSVALDTSSRTSVALTKVLFEKFWGGGRSFISHEPDVEQMLAKSDAALVIGDPALRAKTAGYHVYDLATEWKKLTGLGDPHGRPAGQRPGDRGRRDFPTFPRQRTQARAHRGTGARVVAEDWNLGTRRAHVFD